MAGLSPASCAPCPAHYEKAADYARSLPENWRSIRISLLENSCADACELQEDWPEAERWHEQALDTFSSCKDRQIYDLAGYEAELVMAAASCFSMADETEKALDLLKNRFEPLYASMENEQETAFWKSRQAYLEGLCLLYEGKPETALPLLEKARKGFGAFMEKSGIHNPEYYARACYYAASCQDEPEKARALLEEALPLFEKLEGREPAFFRYSIADIHNQLGILSHHFDPPAALQEYGSALQAYEKLLGPGQEDADAARSLLITAFNIVQLPAALSEKEQEDLAACMLHALQILKKTTKETLDDLLEETSGSSLLQDFVHNTPHLWEILEKSLHPSLLQA